jgi:hypothetical protein
VALQTESLGESDNGPHWTEVAPNPPEKHETEKHDRRPPETEERGGTEVRTGVRRSDSRLINRIEKQRNRDQIDGVLYVLIREKVSNHTILGEGNSTIRSLLVLSNTPIRLPVRCHNRFLAAFFYNSSGPTIENVASHLD